MIFFHNFTDDQGPSSSGNLGDPRLAPTDRLEQLLEQYLSQSSIFKKKDALSIHYVPDQLLYRDEQILELGHILAPLLRSQKCSNVLLYGKPGTGKTAVALFLLRHITSKAREVGAKIAFSYCNAKLIGTEYRVVVEVGRQVGLQLPFTGLSVGEALSRLKAFLLSNGRSLLVVLDEIDFLVRHFGDNLLYELTRSADLISGSGLFSLVGVSNDLTFKDWLDPRVLSSLTEEEMVFPPYTVGQLRDILAVRAGLAFCDGCVSESALNLCAALSGSEHGDARRAVELLRVAGEIAEREGVARVEETHVYSAIKRIDQDRTYEAISTLPLHAKLILVTALEDGRNSTGAIYERYSDLCHRLALSPVTGRRASGILNELDVLGLLNVQVVSSGRYGRTKRVRLNVDPQLVRSALREEPLLSSLLG